MSCKDCDNKANDFQKEREDFNKNQKTQENSNGNDLRKVAYPERFDFFGNGNQK